MKKTFALLVLIALVPIHVFADGPSTYEAAGALDAYIKLCADTVPKKPEYYKQHILASRSCGKPFSELEKNLAEIRESRNTQIRNAYQRYFNEVTEPFNAATKKQKEEFCEHFS